MISRSNLVANNKYKMISCGCYTKEGKHLINKNDDRKHHIIKFLYGKLKIRNKKIGFDNESIVSFEEFAKIIIKPCSYCGMSNSNTTLDIEVYEYNYKEKENFTKNRTSDGTASHKTDKKIEKNAILL